jgi:hypothetical protein
MPETFSDILQLFKISEPSYGTVKEVEQFGKALFDDIFAA